MTTPTSNPNDDDGDDDGPPPQWSSLHTDDNVDGNDSSNVDDRPISVHVLITLKIIIV